MADRPALVFEHLTGRTLKARGCRRLRSAACSAPQEMHATRTDCDRATDTGAPRVRGATARPTQIRIKTEFASPKHGTELVGYRNDPVANRPYDFAWGANIPRPPDAGPQGFPRPLGNMAVGTVAEVGPEVTRFAVGDRVFGHFLDPRDANRRRVWSRSAP